MIIITLVTFRLLKFLFEDVFNLTILCSQSLCYWDVFNFHTCLLWMYSWP